MNRYFGWDFLADAEVVSPEKLKDIIAEANESLAIFAAALLTTKKNMQKSADM